MSYEASDRTKLFLHAGGSIASALGDTAEFLDHAQRALFVAYAVHEYDDYTAHMQSQFESIGVSLTGLHTFADPMTAIDKTDAIIVGGGNTFRLLKTLQELSLIEALRTAVRTGTPYWGASAGANVACPSIRTTNDMPIVEPRTFEALDLVSFQINPHYLDEPSDPDEVKETREFRIKEFLEENDVVVVGLREDSWIIRDGDQVTLRGGSGAVLFRPGMPPETLQPGDDLSFLFDVAAYFDVRLPETLRERGVKAD